MNKRVVIACDEQGQYSVGEMGNPEPGSGLLGESQEPQLQPVPNLDAALNMAAEILESDPEGEQQGQEALEAGFKKGQGYQGGM